MRIPKAELRSRAEKTEALLGAMTLIAPTVLITDEETARRMLDMHEAMQAGGTGRRASS